MNQAERDLIASLFARIKRTEGASRDPEAEAYISDEVSRQPHAPLRHGPDRGGAGRGA
ncbi:DUF2076 domain-containing protein [Chenggangzhangella methanolivorans]|uniref:DUF2076 domain-containing protein n=1 Tax=Chenggangzhangella methanolivorans TaxID=1437009 RepID=A0A9E6ULP4_9HYPH|nr:DUF2076 domain-containing protein [Chenggangzhangella methanolivorans]QZN99190.1 DUF2076 domain-containing protein [Chenggangzhangella methanolivorans]